MRSSSAEHNEYNRIYFAIFIALIITYLIIKNINPLVFFVPIGICLLLLLALLDFKKFILLFFAAKPFIDLTVNFRWIKVQNFALNSLEIIAILVFLIFGLKYVHSRNKKIYNEKLILMFIFFYAFASFVGGYYKEGHNIFFILSNIIRICDAYFIYFVLSIVIRNEDYKIKFIEVVWLSSFFVGLVSILLYLSGNYNVDITRGVVRFTGFYNDPGGPSYLSIITLVFGSLYFEISKKNEKEISLLKQIIFLFTFIQVGFILAITLTKSAFLMLLVYALMWWGIYKKKFRILIPMVFIIGYLAYSNMQGLQTRFAPEIEFVSLGNRNIDGALSLGSGRIARWQRLINIFIQEYSLSQKLFGSSYNFGAHNQYIAYLMQIGMLGLLIFSLIIARFYKKLFFMFNKYKYPEYFAGISLVSVYVVYGLTGHPFDYTTLLWYLMFLLSLLNVHNCQNLSKIANLD